MQPGRERLTTHITTLTCTLTLITLITYPGIKAGEGSSEVKVGMGAGERDDGVSEGEGEGEGEGCRKSGMFRV